MLRLGCRPENSLPGHCGSQSFSCISDVSLRPFLLQVSQDCQNFALLFEAFCRSLASCPSPSHTKLANVPQIKMAVKVSSFWWRICPHLFSIASHLSSTLKLMIWYLTLLFHLVSTEILSATNKSIPIMQRLYSEDNLWMIYFV